MSADDTAFLYPFIDAEEDDAASLLAHLATSASAKIAESIELRRRTLTDSAAAIAAAAAAIAARVTAGGRVFVFGNGGSSTDAEALVSELLADERPIPALSLVHDQAVITALANDIGHDVVFARQLIALAGPGDVVIGISTSGGSRNVLAAFAEAHRRGLLTIATCGYGGGAVAASDDVDHCVVIGSESVHRIQEAQAVVHHELCRQTRLQLFAAEVSQ